MSAPLTHPSLEALRAELIARAKECLGKATSSTSNRGKKQPNAADDADRPIPAGYEDTDESAGTSNNARSILSSGPPITYTLFKDLRATTKIERADVPFLALVERIKNAPPYVSKAACPLISLGEYGDLRSESNCLRHAANVKRIFGVEGDYDGEQVPIEVAATLLQDANIEAALYTSPSHTPGKPRYRVLAPLSEAQPPVSRAQFVARLNRVLRGVLTSESFTLSQSFYLGRVGGAKYQVCVTHGRCIDLASEIEPQYFSGAKYNVKTYQHDETTDDELRACFRLGEGRYTAMLKLSSRWASQGMSADDIAGALHGLLDTCPNGTANADGVDLRSRVAGMAQTAWCKFGETRRAPEPDGKQPKADDDADPPLFDATKSSIGLATFMEIQPPPQFIIEGILPLDVCLQSAPGGSSKSTFQLWQAIHIILQRDFLGRPILKPGRVLIVTAEDPLRRIKYRAHYMAAQMGLSEQEMETVGENLLIEDQSGKVCRLAALDGDGNLRQTAVVGQLIETYAKSNLSLLVLDPYVFFGPGERLVNDGDSMMAQVGARLVRELGCAVEFIAHSGKVNARESRSDQYASRGGSALPDGMRMVQVLTVVGPKDAAVPDLARPEDIAEGRILRLSIPKITDAPPITEPFYLRRDRFGFEWIEQTGTDPREALLRDIGKVQQFIDLQLRDGVRHTTNTLEPCGKQLGMARNDLRRVLHAALERGYLTLKELPSNERRGQRTHYLVVGASV